jgi:uncharacterized membrane protein
MTYFVLKYLHIVGASVLLGTGSGIAFFMLVAHIQGKPAVIAAVGRIVVLADFVFTASAVVVQPVTGLLLVWTVGYSITEGWIMWSLVLYVFTGLFWLPVVWMQMRLRDLAADAARLNEPLPQAYYTTFMWWCAFGVPAFLAVAIIIWLMIARPQIAFFY